MPRWQGLLLSVVSVLVTVAAVEVAFRFMAFGKKARKVTAPTIWGYVQCYTSRDAALPIDLEVARSVLPSRGSVRG